MVFAAFAVDVGAWYAEADGAQRAADAAALAGVVEMPDFNQATLVARETARLNGFDHNSPDVSVNTFRRGSQGIRVEIETKGESFFGKVALDEIDIERGATANYILPVPLGNPGSALGAGLDTPPIVGDPAERMLLALNSYCLGYENGDPFGVGRLGSGSDCTNDAANPRYPAAEADRGYVFVLDFTGDTAAGTPVTGQWELQIFEPGLCGQLFESNGPRIRTTLWRGDTTLFTDEDNIVDANRVPNAQTNTPEPYLWPESSCSEDGSPWVTAYDIDADTAQGRWLLKTETLQNTSEDALNSFGLRIVQSGGNAPCGSIGPSSTCPQLYARNWLPIFIPRWIDNSSNLTFGSARSAIFYLADVPKVHNGKVLEVKLFDPGEGMDNMQIIAPDGQRLPMRISTLDDTATTQSSFADLTETCPTTSAFGDSVANVGTDYRCLKVTNDRFNGEEVTIRINIPSGSAYQCPTSGGEDNCWWRVRYAMDAGSSPKPLQDRTTWSIRVIGDPIRLTE